MKNIKVSAIVRDKDGKFLLQERDDEPYVGKRCLFGGGLEEGETIEETCRREIYEEINYVIKDLEFFRTYPKKDNIDNPIFVVQDFVSLNQLELHEGSDMRFFSIDEFETIEFAFHHKEILADYLKSIA